MANLHETFTEFNDIIKLNSEKKDQLRKSRNSVRTDIENYFNDNVEKLTVEFKGQGSFSVNTTILPLNCEYDVDDGVYIFGDEKDKPTVQKAHDWVYDAVKNRTKQETLDKNSCIRVQYAGSYHVDLPIYFKTNKTNEFYIDDEIPLLAHKTKGWIESDPYAFKLWFEEQTKGKFQIKRIVRFLKSWADKRSNDNKNLKFPNGLIFTILACNSFVADERDDMSFYKTLEGIQKSIDDSRFSSAVYECFRPTTDTTENILEKFSADSVKNNFLNELNNIIISGRQAIEMESKKDACVKWQKHLGDRFPCINIVENSESLAKAFSVQEIIKHDNKSAND